MPGGIVKLFLRPAFFTTSFFYDHAFFTTNFMEISVSDYQDSEAYMSNKLNLFFLIHIFANIFSRNFNEVFNY